MKVLYFLVLLMGRVHGYEVASSRLKLLVISIGFYMLCLCPSTIKKQWYDYKIIGYSYLHPYCFVGAN
jgi:hypothetical protein